MSKILDEIHQIVGSRGLLLGEDVTARRSSWTDATPCKAIAIVRPASTQELSAVMTLCHEQGQVVVPIGGGTGLVNATVASPNDLMVSLERMNKVDDIDINGRTLTVQAGVPLQTVQDIAAANDFLFPIDLGARGTAQIGGLMSTNAGGNQVLRYGMMREQVLGLEVVMADGTIISTMNTMLKNNAGYDVKHMFIGSEGTLGIITAAVLRLRPAMSSKLTALVAVDDFKKISTLLKDMASSLGGTLNSFEVMWNDFYRLITDAHPERTLPLTNDYPFYVIIESCGADETTDRERFEGALEKALNSGLITDAVISQSPKQREEIWGIRDDIETLFGEMSPMVTFDISIPIDDLNQYVSLVAAKLKQKWPSKAKFVTFGHLGDSNVHLVITVGADTHQQEKDIMDIVYGEVSAFNGSISAEHGVGLEKVSYLHHSRSEEEIALMRTLKKALDPKAILNPGRVFDSL